MPRQVRPPAKLEEFETLCRQRGLPLTVQRRAVLEALVRHHDHPTADRIFEEVSVRLHEVSRTTVYRVLETLVRLGIARKVCHPGAAARFEIESRRHHHLVCLRCGRMIDLEDPRFDALPFPQAGAKGFQLTDYSIQFRGTCPACARATASQRGTARRTGRGHKNSQRRERK